MPPRGNAVGDPAIRIYQGETIAGQAWASAAIQLTGQFRIIYDDGTEDLFSIDRIAAGATRTRTGLSSKRVAKQDGWVNNGSVYQVAGASNSTAAQRGACYVQMGIMAGAPGDSTGIFPEIRVQLARGYCYLGHPVAFGENVEPGPAGGHGNMREISVTAVAGGGAAGLAVTAVPTNAIWRVKAGILTYVASATVGTRAVQPRFRDNAANTYWRLATAAPTAGQTAIWEFAENQGSNQTTNLGLGSINTEDPSPVNFMPAAYDIFEADSANIDAADTVALEMAVEEWVIPGL